MKLHSHPGYGLGNAPLQTIKGGVAPHAFLCGVYTCVGPTMTTGLVVNVSFMVVGTSSTLWISNGF